MKRNKKLVVASLLMTLSIILLVLFQAYWLRNAYKDEYRRLKREAGMTLRFTIMQEQFKEVVAERSKDSLQNTSMAVDSVRISARFSRNLKADTLHHGNFNIYVGADTGRPPMPPRIFTFEQESRMEDQEKTNPLMVDFPVPIGSADLAVIEKNYRTALDENGIRIAFTLSIMPGRNRPDRVVETTAGNKNTATGINSNRRMDFFNAHSEIIRATFESPVWFLIKRIQWSLLFAFIMIAVTTTAFVFLYRNLVQQHRLAEMKSDLINNITHELKTPIATVSVAIEALKNFDAIKDAAKTKTYLDISAGELQRLNLLVDRVLKLSLFEQEQINLQVETVDIGVLMNEVINSLKLQFEKNNAVVRYKSIGSDLVMHGDRMHLIGVFYNLLDNALKYSPNNPEIEIVIERKTNDIEIRIADNGIGIPEAYRKKVFDKFFRVPHGDTHNIKGYGLGLSYVSEVVQHHGGVIQVNAGEKQGSEFIVSLPVRK